MRHPSCNPPLLLPDEADSSAAAVFGAFMRAMHSHRQLMARKMAESGISPAQMFCLREVAHNAGITQRDLAERLNVSRPTLTVMLQKMEKSGLIERHSDQADQRFTRIYLASDGENVHEQMHQVIGSVVTDVVGPLSETDRAELTRLLHTLGDNMSAAIETPEKADR